MANSSYYFGSLLLNSMANGLGITIYSKNIDMPTVEPVIFSMARRDGAKKSGQRVLHRDVHIVLKVVGSSRVDLLNRLDTLKQALFLQGQQLIIHENDARYYQNVDCLSAPMSLQVGRDVVSMAVPCLFRCYDPYAYSPTLSTYDTGTVALTLSGSLYNFPAINIAGGGTVYSYPLFHIINKTVAGGQWNSISISQSQDSQTITANTSSSVALPNSNNDYIDIQCDPAQTSGWSIQTNGSGLFSDPQGVFPVIEPGATTFNISIACASAVSADCLISWRSRYL